MALRTSSRTTAALLPGALVVIGGVFSSLSDISRISTFFSNWTLVRFRGLGWASGSDVTDEAGDNDKSISSILCLIPAVGVLSLEVFKIGTGDDVVSILEGLVGREAAGLRVADERETMTDQGI